MKKLVITILVLFLVVVNFSACKKTESKVISGLFGTEIKIVVEDVKKSKDYDEFIDTAETFLNQINAIASLDSGEIKKINDAKVGQKIIVSQTTAQILQSAKTIYSITNGKFNPALYPLTVLWNFSKETYQGATATYQKPSVQAVENALAKTDFSTLSIEQQGRSFVITKNADIKIDIGGIVKGFASDIIKSLMQDYGYKKAYITLGSSSIYLLGDYPVSIRNPFSDNLSDTYLKIETSGETAISTSGDYERFYHIDGQKYCHIIDNSTGNPIASGVCSVTVVGPYSAYCDALSTALMAMDKQTATDFVKNKLSINQLAEKVFIVYSDKTILTNAIDGYSLTADGFTINKI